MVMNSLQWIQVLGGITISVAAVTELREFLVKRTNLLMVWNVLSAIAIGLCAGFLVGAVNLPGKYEMFGASTLFVILVYSTTGEERTIKVIHSSQQVVKGAESG